MQSGKVATNAKRHFSIYQNMPHRNSNFFFLSRCFLKVTAREKQKCCVFLSCLLGQVKTPACMGMKEILQAWGFSCIIRFTAFSSSRRAHQKARVTPLHLSRSCPTLIPHPSEERLPCTLSETTISFTAFGHCCQSCQLNHGEKYSCGPKAL